MPTKSFTFINCDGTSVSYEALNVLMIALKLWLDWVLKSSLFSEMVLLKANSIFQRNLIKYIKQKMLKIVISILINVG